jgi:hypothetical protein
MNRVSRGARRDDARRGCRSTEPSVRMTRRGGCRIVAPPPPATTRSRRKTSDEAPPREPAARHWTRLWARHWAWTGKHRNGHSERKPCFYIDLRQSLKRSRDRRQPPVRRAIRSARRPATASDRLHDGVTGNEIGLESGRFVLRPEKSPWRSRFRGYYSTVKSGVSSRRGQVQG